MISSETPDKLRQIIQDTWPNLYMPPSKRKDKVGITSVENLEAL